MIAPTLSPAILPQVLSPLDRLPGPMLNVIPGREHLVFLMEVRGGVLLPDSIGLSAAALWAALPATHRSIYLVDENTLRSAETIITNIEASEYLNDGGELVGTEARGYAQYEDGTAGIVLYKAYKHFKQQYPLVLFGSESTTFNGDSAVIW